MTEVCKERIRHIRLKPNMTVNELVEEMSGSGCFAAGRLARAVEIYERMLKDKAIVVFTLAGAMVPSGMREVICEMIRRQMVNVIVSTGANMVHDALEAFGGAHYKNVEASDDEALYKLRIDRVYDSFIPENDFRMKFDKSLIEILMDIQREKGETTFSCAEFFSEIGKRLTDESSIIYNAHKYGVPIFVPAVQDSCYGLTVWEYVAKHNGKPIVIDAFKGLHPFFKLIQEAHKTGALVVGGGVPKNFAFQAAFEVNRPYNYAIQITTDRVESGGLSGASLEEAVSWGKLKADTGKVQVICDATICLPILVGAVMERLFEK